MFIISIFSILNMIESSNRFQSWSDDSIYKDRYNVEIVAASVE